MNDVADLASLPPSLSFSPTTLARRNVLSLTLSLSLSPSCEPETTSLCDKFRERGPPFLVVRLRKTNKRCVEWGGIERKQSKDHKNLERKSLHLRTNTPQLVACGVCVLCAEAPSPVNPLFPVTEVVIRAKKRTAVGGIGWWLFFS